MARRRLPKGIFEFMDRGNGDEVALAHNRAAFERFKFNPHVLVDTSPRTLETTLFGRKHAMPIAIAPTGSAGLTWFQGEIALARAAREAGIPFALATGSMTAVASGSTSPFCTNWTIWIDLVDSRRTFAKSSSSKITYCSFAYSYPFTISSFETLRSHVGHLLSYRIRVWQGLWIWLKDKASDRAAGYILTGMFTSESLRKPFQVGLTVAV